jgi:hypothetical protein
VTKGETLLGVKNCLPRRRGIKGEGIQGENLSESGVLITEGVK